MTRPKPIEVVQIKHWGRWVAAVILLYLVTALTYSLWNNPKLDKGVIAEYLFKDLTLRGLLVTVELTVITMVIGLIGGTLIAVMRMSDNFILRTIASIYTWLFRGTPLLVQIIFWGFLAALIPDIFIGLPFTGITFGSLHTNAVVGVFTAAILALALNEVAYASELVRAGIISVDKGQTEAALSLGMSSGVTMRGVVLPQAMRVIIPPVGNETITMLKMTALVSVISGDDLLTNVQRVYTQTFQVIPLLVVASIWYLVLTTLLSIGQHYLERHFGKGFGAKEAAAAEKKSLKREAARV